MKATIHVTLEIEVEDSPASRDEVRAALVRIFKSLPLAGNTYSLTIPRRHANNEYHRPMVRVWAAKLPLGAERAPAAYIRFEE